MAYYNPFQNDESYYNPYQQQQNNPSLVSTLSTVAKNMVVFGGLFTLGTAASRIVSSRVGSFIKGANLGKISTIAKGIENPTIGSILKNTGLGRDYTAYKESTGLYKAAQARQAYLSHISADQPYRLGVARITSAFKNPTTFAATIGGVWKRNVLTGLGVSFAIDKLSGNYQSVAGENKPWYDVPGRVGNLAKWFVNTSIYSSAFGLLGPLAKGVSSVGMMGLQRSFNGPLGKYMAKSLSQNAPGIQHLNGETRFFKDKVLENARSEHDKTFVSNAIRWGQNFTTSVGENLQNLNSAVRTVFSHGAFDAFRQQGTFRNKIGTALAPITKAIQQIKEINSRAEQIRGERLVNTRMEYSGIRALQFLHAVATDAAITNVATKDSLDAQVMSVRESMKSKQTFLEQMLPGAKKVKNKDIVRREWIREQLSGLKNRYDSKSAYKFMREILNLDVGENVFKIGNKIVNLQSYSPKNILHSAISPVLNKEFRIPLTGFKFSFGEITHLNALITPRPRLEFFVNPELIQTAKASNIHLSGIESTPLYAAGNIQNKEGYTSISDIMSKQEANVSLFMRGGNWSFFGKKTPKTISTNRDLNYSPRSGHFRFTETNKILINTLKSEGKSGREISTALGGIYEGNSKFIKFFDRLGFQLPERLSGLLASMNDKLGGRNREYIKAVNNIFKGTQDILSIGSSMQVLDDIRSHTSQVLGRVLKSPEAVDLIAKHGRLGNLSADLKDALYNEKRLVERFNENDLLADGWKYKPEIRRDLELVKAYPDIARQHETVKSLGGLGSMTSVDKLRVSLTDHILSKDMSYMDQGNGFRHPLIDALPELQKAGFITGREAKTLQLHAKLSSLQDMSEEKIISKVGKNYTAQQLWSEMFDNEKAFGLNIHSELISFINENKLRKTNLNKYERRLLQRDIHFERFINNTPYYSMGRGAEGIGQFLETSMNRLTDIMGEISPFKHDPVSHIGILGGSKYIASSVLKVAAITGAYRLIDTSLAANPLLNSTALDDGITGFAADQVAKLRLTSAKVSDILGVTGALKYMSGLMPGSTSTFPGLLAGAAMAMYSKSSPFGIMRSMALGAVINRIANPYLPDFSKSYEEVRKEYSGEEEVPFMKSPTWLLGSTPWEGTNVAGYQPNWYVRTKSRWEASDTLYGSEFRKLIHKPLFPLGFNIGDVLDPYYMERKHYFDRPYPVTGRLFTEVPIIGDIIAPIGRILKPEKTMHQEFLQGEWAGTTDGNNPSQSSLPPPTYQQNLLRMNQNSSMRSIGGITANSGNYTTGGLTPWSKILSNHIVGDVTDAMGLHGFLLRTAADKFFGKTELIPTFESAGRMASMTRSFYDKNLGGMGVLTEPIRRLITKPEYNEYGINPIPNMMPNWLPSQFLSGDPYAKIMKGELRLPGEAYLKTHPDTEKSLPARASMWGAPVEHIAQYFAGLLPPNLKEEYDVLETGTLFHRKIQDTLAAEGLLIQAESLVFDVKNDISGHVDAIIRDGRGGKGKRALEIKTINNKGFQKLDAPKDQHLSQINFYLHQLRFNNGTILYVNRDNPSQVKTFEVRYDKNRWERDIEKLRRGRQIARDMMKENVGDTLGYSYSWLDRLEILADVAPSSKEYQEAKELVLAQIKAGQFTQKEIDKYRRTLQHRQTRLRKYELYPNRFKGKIMSPDSQVNIESINQNIKAGAAYSLPERVIGAAWETFTNSNNSIINKFWAFKDPLEHYKETRLYGKEYKPWDEPYRSFIEPFTRGALSKTNPIGGGLSWGLGGYTVGGEFGGFVGSLLGSAYGTVNGLFRSASDSVYIPDMINDQRKINSYFDKLKYERGNMMASLSQGLTRKEFLDAKSATLEAFNTDSNPSIGNLFRATGYMEKPYIEAWVNTTDPDERKNILNTIPEELAKALEKVWSRNDGKSFTQNRNVNISKDLAFGRQNYNFDSSVMDPRIELDDIKLKTIEDNAYNAHDFGLGWNEQLMRIQESPFEIPSADLTDSTPIISNISPSQIRQQVYDLFKQFGINGSVNVYINNVGGPNLVDLTVRRDRSLSIINSLRYRKQYGLS